jgi:hypothetical protein
MIVEMGVNFGWTSLLLCRLNPGAEIHGVDLYPLLRDVPGYPDLPTGYILQLHNISNFQLHIMNSWELKIANVDLCFIDADHENKSVLNDSFTAWENRNEKGDWCIAWDDYHPSNKGVVDAINDFLKVVGYPLHKIGSWHWIGSKQVPEWNLENMQICDHCKTVLFPKIHKI